MISLMLPPPPPPVGEVGRKAAELLSDLERGVESHRLVFADDLSGCFFVRRLLSDVGKWLTDTRSEPDLLEPQHERDCAVYSGLYRRATVLFQLMYARGVQLSCQELPP